MKIELVKSTIGQLPAIRKTVRALGLRRLHQVRDVKESASVAGMLKRVGHLIKVIER